MLVEKCTKPSFPILPTLIDCPLATTGIRLEDNDLFFVLQETYWNNSFALAKSLTLNALVLNLIKLANTLTSLPAEAQPALAMTYHTTSRLLRVLAPFMPVFAEKW